VGQIDEVGFAAFVLIVRVGRIGLPSHPWQGRVLPLNHTRNVVHYKLKNNYLEGDLG
jgi:hypothetical protein